MTMLLVCVLLVMVGRNIEMDEEEWEQATVLYNSDIDIHTIWRRRLIPPSPSLGHLSVRIIIKGLF